MGHHPGAVAVEVAATDPERVSGVVLSAPGWTGPECRVAQADGRGVDSAETDDGGHLVTSWGHRHPYYARAVPTC